MLLNKAIMMAYSQNFSGTTLYSLCDKPVKCESARNTYYNHDDHSTVVLLIHFGKTQDFLFKVFEQQYMYR